jgi:hypothetical protein
LKSKRSQSSLVVTTIETDQSVSRSVSCQRDLAHIGAEGYPQHLGGSDPLAVGCSRMELDSFNHSAVVCSYLKKNVRIKISMMDVFVATNTQEERGREKGVRKIENTKG